MHDLEDAITERRSTRMFLRDKPVRQTLSPKPWPSRCGRRRTPTSSRGTLCWPPARPGTASSRPCSRWPRSSHRVCRCCRTPLHICGAISARWSTGRWAFPATTPRGDASPSCATGSSSGHPWPESSACTAISTTSTRWASACSSRHCCSPLTARGLGTCVQVSIAGYPDVVREQLNIGEDMRICAVSRSGTRSGVPRQCRSGAAKSRRKERGVRRQVTPARACADCWYTAACRATDTHGRVRC